MERIDGLGGILAGPANVVMQMGRPAVAYGVMESRVGSGRLMEHPLKRFRTTYTYLAVATMGGEAERRRMSRAVDRVHREVRSGPDSPVTYDAFDPELQLWVAACLYKGAEDVATRFWGPMGRAETEAFYRAAAPLGTTLQVPSGMWPADRSAFAAYWSAGLSQVSFDSNVRRYLRDLVTLRFLPPPVQLVYGPGNLWITTGFLAPEFREAIDWSWSALDQACFDRLVSAAAAARRPLPARLRRFPLDWFLWDFRMRSQLGLRLV